MKSTSPVLTFTNLEELSDHFLSLNIFPYLSLATLVALTTVISITQPKVYAELLIYLFNHYQEFTLAAMNNEDLNRLKTLIRNTSEEQCSLLSNVIGSGTKPKSAYKCQAMHPLHVMYLQTVYPLFDYQRFALASISLNQFRVLQRQVRQSTESQQFKTLIGSLTEHGNHHFKNKAFSAEDTCILYKFLPNLPFDRFALANLKPEDLRDIKQHVALCDQGKDFKEAIKNLRETDQVSHSERRFSQDEQVLLENVLMQSTSSHAKAIHLKLIRFMIFDLSLSIFRNTVRKSNQAKAKNLDFLSLSYDGHTYALMMQLVENFIESIQQRQENAARHTIFTQNDARITFPLRYNQNGQLNRIRLFLQTYFFKQVYEIFCGEDIRLSNFLLNLQPYQGGYRSDIEDFRKFLNSDLLISDVKLSQPCFDCLSNNYLYSFLKILQNKPHIQIPNNPFSTIIQTLSEIIESSKRNYSWNFQWHPYLAFVFFDRFFNPTTRNGYYSSNTNYEAFCSKKGGLLCFYLSSLVYTTPAIVMTCLSYQRPNYNAMFFTAVIYYLVTLCVLSQKLTYCQMSNCCGIDSFTHHPRHKEMKDIALLSSLILNVVATPLMLVTNFLSLIGDLSINITLNLIRLPIDIFNNFTICLYPIAPRREQVLLDMIDRFAEVLQSHHYEPSQDDLDFASEKLPNTFYTKFARHFIWQAGDQSPTTRNAESGHRYEPPLIASATVDSPLQTVC